MDVGDITSSLITNTLKAWRQLEEPPPGLLDLDLLRDGTAGRVEREIHLRKLVESLVAAGLTRQRRAEGLPAGKPDPTRDDLLAAVTRDFACNNAELEVWSALYHRYLAPVPLSVEALATAAHLDARNFRRRVGNGTQQLAGELQRKEMEEHQRRRHIRRSRHLPPPEFSRLFGVDAARRNLAEQLRDESGPGFISIEGLGGIGKTALARAVAHTLAHDSHFEGISWVSARQTWLNDQGIILDAPDAATSLVDIVNRLATQLGLAELAGLTVSEKLERLALFLGSSRYLIIIDNLESVSDVDALLPALMPLARPARFLLTSRESMSRYPVVSCFKVPSLLLDDSRALIESELRRHGQDTALTRQEVAALHEVIGGAPLALKLVASQMSRWPLSVLLDDMRRAHRNAPGSLYTFIYQRSWLALGDDARRLLLSLLTIAPDGEDIDWLRLMSFLPPDEFDAALAQLLAYSLLLPVGSPDAPRYRLHRLTATFLQTEILSDWEGATGSPDTDTG